MFVAYLIYNFCFKKTNSGDSTNTSNTNSNSISNNINSMENNTSNSNSIETLNINELSLDSGDSQECSVIDTNPVPSQSQSNSVLASLRKLRKSKIEIYY